MKNITISIKSIIMGLGVCLILLFGHQTSCASSFTIGQDFGGGYIIKLPTATSPGVIVSDVELTGCVHLSDALTACSNFHAAGHNNWRLPSIHEFKLIVLLSPMILNGMGLHNTCTRPNSGTPPYAPYCTPCLTSNCNCNYWTKEPPNSTNVQFTIGQFTLTNNASIPTSSLYCYSGVTSPSTTYCRTRAVREFNITDTW